MHPRILMIAAKCGRDPRLVEDVRQHGELTATGKRSVARQLIADALRAAGFKVPGPRTTALAGKPEVLGVSSLTDPIA